MSLNANVSNQLHDYILHKPRKMLELLEDISDDGGTILQSAVDSFLISVVEAYGMIRDMSSSDKQQVLSRLAAVKENSVQCNHDMIGGSFDGEAWKCVAKSTMESLIESVTEARRAQMLRQLSLCEHNLEGILNCGFIEIVLTEYQRLLINSARLLEYVHKYMSFGTLGGQPSQNILLLCAAQLQKLFPLLLHALEVSTCASGCSTESKNYTVNRMNVCFNKIKQIVEGDITENENECDDLGGGLFITHMDQALSLLVVFETSSGRPVHCDQWRSAVEAVLQHAMSIAQIASQIDIKMIHASAEKVLRECDNLEKECKLSISNPSLIKLHAASLSNALEELEQRVCACVLKMYLEVFSDPYAPLQALCELCMSENVPEEQRKADDLHDAVNHFDCHTDRILQVALFAIACSEDHKRVLGIRSCLASLESLEAHLVPALTTVYLKQASSQIMLASLLVEHWISEVKQLWHLVDGIVDSAALAQVTLQVIQSPTAILKKSIILKRTLQQVELKRLVQSVVCTTEVLVHQLQASSEELHLLQNPTISQSMKELLLAVKEGKAVLHSIESSKATLSIDRILKRCELLVSCVGHMQPLLEELDNPKVDNPKDIPLPPTVDPTIPSDSRTNNSPSRLTVKSKDIEQLVCLGLPLDADIEIDTTDATVSADLLQSLLEKTSTQGRYTTSFLYNKPERTSKVSSLLKMATPRNTPSSFRIIRKAPQLEPRHLLHQTLCLDVKKLASQSEAVRCQSIPVNQCQSPFIPKLSRQHEENESHTISTPERIQDLLHVQNKIAAVKVSSESCDHS